MSNRLDATSAVRTYTDGSGKERTAWANLGTAWENKNGVGYRVVLDCMPAPKVQKDGSVKYEFMLFPPKPKGPGGGSPGGGGGQSTGSDDDDLPF